MKSSYDLCHGETHSNQVNHSTLCGGSQVGDRVLHNLLKAEEIGKTPMQDFIAEGIESNAKSFYAPI